MANGSDAMIRKVGEMLDRGEVPAKITLSALWAGMAAHTEADKRRESKIDRIDKRVAIVTATLAIYGTFLILLAGALLSHLGKGG